MEHVSIEGRVGETNPAGNRTIPPTQTGGDPVTLRSEGRRSGGKHALEDCDGAIDCLVG